jgi:hypothetical protein
VKLVEIWPQELAKRRHRGAGAIELILEALEVAGDEVGAAPGVVGGDDRLDLGERDVEFA